MFNLIIADTIGSTYEGGDLKGFSLPLLPKGSHFTDDSVLMAATAEVILLKRASGSDLSQISSEDFARSYKNWGRRFPGVGYSPQFKSWLSKDSLSPIYSLGSGAVSRALPIAWCSQSEETVLALAEASALASHDSTEAVNGAKAVTHAIHKLIKGDEVESVRSFIEGLYFVKLSYNWEELHQESGFSTNAEDCAGLGLAIGLTAKNIEDAMRLCLYVGGDTDTIGAIAAAVMDARQPDVTMPEIFLKVKEAMTGSYAKEIWDIASQYQDEVMYSRHG
jgi:ADP-ribosylglycohydrolase